jgi:hypothetical protein
LVDAHGVPDASGDGVKDPWSEKHKSRIGGLQASSDVENSDRSEGCGDAHPGPQRRGQAVCPKLDAQPTHAAASLRVGSPESCDEREACHRNGVPPPGKEFNRLSVHSAKVVRSGEAKKSPADGPGSYSVC